MHELVGKVAVVTGAASGIGKGMAERFAGEGMRLVLADIEPQPLAETAKVLADGGAEVLDVEADVADAAAVDHLADATYERFGAAHVLCNNAGVGAGGPLWEIELDDWQWVLGVNLWGVIHGIRSFVPRMVAAGEEGHVVNTASLAGLFSGPTMGPYNASKHAVVAISETLAMDLQSAAAPIGVSVLCPGFVNTRIFEADRNRPLGRFDDLDPERREMARQLITAGTDPSVIAGHVVDAIRENRLHILTHPELLGIVEARMKTILGQ